MKKISFLLFLFVTISLISCKEGNNKPTLKQANGRINHVLVVIKNSLWQGEVGDEIRKIITEPVLGLPQPEPLLDISQVPNDAFNSMFRASRNVIYIEIADEEFFNIKKDVYAQPQKVVSIIGKDKKSVIDQVNKHSNEIINAFKQSDLLSIQRELKKEAIDANKIKTFTKNGFSFTIPRTYRMVEDNGDFLWYRYRLSDGKSMEIIAYTLPIENEEDEIGNRIAENRDLIGEKYIPGSSEGFFMITEKAYTPHTFLITLDGKKAFETRGKWEVKGDFMAGPFLNYTVVDKVNNRLVVVEGFTFAPAINKRDYMFELEAILKTLKIK